MTGIKGNLLAYVVTYIDTSKELKRNTQVSKILGTVCTVSNRPRAVSTLRREVDTTLLGHLGGKPSHPQSSLQRLTWILQKTNWPAATSTETYLFIRNQTPSSMKKILGPVGKPLLCVNYSTGRSEEAARIGRDTSTLPARLSTRSSLIISQLVSSD